MIIYLLIEKILIEKILKKKLFDCLVFQHKKSPLSISEKRGRLFVCLF